MKCGKCGHMPDNILKGKVGCLDAVHALPLNQINVHELQRQDSSCTNGRSLIS